MVDSKQNLWHRYRAWRKRHSRVARLSIRLTEFIVVLLLLGRISHTMQAICMAFIICLAIVLFPLLVVLLARWITRRVLWKVRNRLIVTYILMGLAPIVLFGTLTLIAAYFLAGQYEANAALIPIHEAEQEVEHEASGLALFLLLHGTGPINSTGITTGSTSTSDISMALLDKNVWKPLGSSAEWNIASANPFAKLPPPAWLHPGFQGIVALHDDLYVVSLRSATQGAHTITALASMPLDQDKLNVMAKPLGRVRLAPGMFGGDEDWDEKGPVQVSVGNNQGVHIYNNKPVFTDAPNNTSNAGATPDTDDKAPTDPKAIAAEKAVADKVAASEKASEVADEETFNPVRGGAVPPSTHFWDTRVPFAAPVPVISWTSGTHLPAVVNVVSRVTVLYQQLFSTSAKIGLLVRIALISIASFFALIEFFALWMALLLGRTITCSVADLYRATAEIDRGNLAHRVAVKRHDQLGALAGSFNRMAGSLQDLLVQQREKDRLLNELSIAQEVQKNLFPHSPVSLPGLELHAVCIPARSVSGDYYDFIFGSNGEFGTSFGPHGAALHASPNGDGKGKGCKLCIALGDISGKGISAALLMASLNSAVRAFSLGEGVVLGTDGCPSPARLLALLNRHLYRSTQPEKYATLFLAFYDTERRTLTYSNAGHLPPLVLSDYKPVQRLDCGGTVVGLLDAQDYEEATVELEPGDLLMAYSDGLTEPENEQGEFGESRLLDCVWQQRQQPLPIVTAHTLQALQTWIGNNEQPDDMTLLLARAL